MLLSSIFLMGIAIDGNYADWDTTDGVWNYTDAYNASPNTGDEIDVDTNNAVDLDWIDMDLVQIYTDSSGLGSILK